MIQSGWCSPHAHISEVIVQFVEHRVEIFNNLIFNLAFVLTLTLHHYSITHTPQQQQKGRILHIVLFAFAHTTNVLSEVQEVKQNHTLQNLILKQNYVEIGILGDLANTNPRSTTFCQM